MDRGNEPAKETNPTPSYLPLSYDICLSFSVALSLISVNVMLATVLFLTGRAESGFRHVEAEKYPPRLLHFKGKRVSTLA